MQDTVSLNEDNSTTISVLVNDTVVLSNVGILISTTTTNGTLVVNANNTVTYSPNANFNGTDSFIYGILDTTLPFPGICDTALVLITVISVNDTPIANSDHFPTNEGQVLITTVRAHFCSLIRLG